MSTTAIANTGGAFTPLSELNGFYVEFHVTGSVAGSGKRADPKGRWRAPVRPYWAILEDRFELMLVNARHVKNVALV